MDDKTPAEQLLDKVAEALTKLLDFTEPFIMTDVIWLSFCLLLKILYLLITNTKITL